MSDGSGAEGRGSVPIGPGTARHAPRVPQVAGRLGPGLVWLMALACGPVSPPPTPLSATATPTIVAIIPSPTPQSSPTPAPTATPMVAVVRVTLRLGLDITPEGELLGEGSTFSPTRQVLIARADFESFGASDALAYRLYRDDALVYASETLRGEEFGAPEEPRSRWIWFGLPQLGGFQPGQYRVELDFNSVLAATAEFEVTR